ncbi:MAG: hypothetical protein ACKOB8_04620, partial [Mycobacterium sp.]
PTTQPAPADHPVEHPAEGIPMQISLRSQMIAGVAAVAATAVAITPITQPDLATMQRLSSSVELSAIANPVSALSDTFGYAVATLTDQVGLLDPEELFWPDSFYSSDFSTLYAPGYFGWVPDLANQFSFGGISALVNNLSGYTYAGVSAPLAVVSGIATAAFNAPFAVVTAAQLALAGDIPGAIAELQTQIIDPIQFGLETALASVGYLLNNALANVQTVVFDAVPRLINGLTSAVVGGVAYLVTDLIGTVSTIVTDISTGDIEGAWNAAIDGLLGGDGTLGNVVSLTIGIGITEFIDYDEGPVLTVTNPSLRSVLTSEGQRLGDFSANGEGGILNDPFFPPEPPVTAPAAAQPAVEAGVEAAVVAESQPSQAEVAQVTVDRPSPGASAPTGTDAAADSAGSKSTASGADAAGSGDDASADATAGPAAPAAADAAGPQATGSDSGAAEKPAKQRSARTAAKASQASRAAAAEG